MEKLSAILVNYKTPELAVRCIANLYRVYENLEIIYVNNSPDDDSSQIVHKDFPKVIVLNLQNPGLSASYNKAATLATSRFILFVGTDAYPTNDTLTAMVTYASKHAESGIITTPLVLEDGTPDFDSHRGFPTMLSSFFKFTRLTDVFPKSGFFNHYHLGNLLSNPNPHEIDATISHFMLVRKEAFDRVGGFDEDFFLYGEDVDFCFRIKEAGYQNIYLPQYKTLHLKGVSVGVRNHNKKDIKRPYEYRKLQVIRSMDAMKLFVNKHYAKRYGFFSLRAIYLGIFLLEKVRVLVEKCSK